MASISEKKEKKEKRSRDAETSTPDPIQKKKAIESLDDKPVSQPMIINPRDIGDSDAFNFSIIPVSEIAEISTSLDQAALEEEEEAETGIKIIEPKTNKVKLTVDDITKLDQKKEKSRQAKEAFAKRNEYGIWVGNLRFTTTADDLRRFFRECGTITRVHLPVTESRNRGFAYINFDCVEAKNRAISLSETEYEGRALLIKDSRDFNKTGRTAAPTKPKNTKELNTLPPSPTIFVGNLPTVIDKTCLRKTFIDFGPIKNVRLSTYQDSGNSKGYGWVDFKSQESATKAVNWGRQHKIGPKVLKVSYATPEATARGYNAPNSGNTAAHEN